MFNLDDLKCLDPEYFCIITVDDYDVTVMSRNTGHYWYLHNSEYPGEGSVVISISISFHIRTINMAERIR